MIDANVNVNIGTFVVTETVSDTSAITESGASNPVPEC